MVSGVQQFVWVPLYREEDCRRVLKEHLVSSGKHEGSRAKGVDIEHLVRNTGIESEKCWLEQEWQQATPPDLPPPAELCMSVKAPRTPPWTQLRKRHRSEASTGSKAAAASSSGTQAAEGAAAADAADPQDLACIALMFLLLFSMNSFKSADND